MPRCACHTYLWDAYLGNWNNLEKTCQVVWWVYWRSDGAIIPKRWFMSPDHVECDRCHCMGEIPNNPNVKDVLPFLVASTDQKQVIEVARRHWGKELHLRREKNKRNRFNIMLRRKAIP